MQDNIQMAKIAAHVLQIAKSVQQDYPAFLLSSWSVLFSYPILQISMKPQQLENIPLNSLFHSKISEFLVKMKRILSGFRGNGTKRSTTDRRRGSRGESGQGDG